MQNGKKYYLNVSSYKYKREYMKLHQPNIDKILNTYSNSNQEITIESQNLCPGGKRCKNYLIIMNLEQKIKALNDTVNQLTKIKEYSEYNHNIDFTPMKTMKNNKKDSFNEICNSFRNSGIKKNLNKSTRNAFGNNTLQPQISEPYRLKLDFKNNENKNGENKKMIPKKLINLDINKFKNIGVKLNAEKLGGDEKNFLNKRENNGIKNNNSNYDEKEKKIQNLLNHIFNNKTNELVIYKKLEEVKNKETNNKRGDFKTINKLNFPKIKVKSNNLMIPNKTNKIKNKRYNSELEEIENKIETKDENKLYFRKFKGNLRNSSNNTKNKILSKSFGFNNNAKEENNNFFKLADNLSKTFSENKKQSLYKLNGFGPLTHNQKPFRLKLDISQKEEKAKSERGPKIIEKINEKINEKIIIKNKDDYQFEKFLQIFEDKNIEKYQLFEDVYNLLDEKSNLLINKLKSLSEEKINDYISFIKNSLKYMKDLTIIFHNLEIFYNIVNTNENIEAQKIKKSINDELMKYKNNIQKIISCNLVNIYIYDSTSDSLILKGENEEIKYDKDKDLIGKCFKSGKPLKCKINDNSHYVSGQIFIKQKQLDKENDIFLYPIKDIDNNIYGVIEAINTNLNSSDSGKYIFDKKTEIIMSFISKALGSCCIYNNYIN